MALPINTGLLGQAIENVQEKAQNLMHTCFNPTVTRPRIALAVEHIIHRLANPHLNEGPMPLDEIEMLANPSSHLANTLLNVYRLNPNWN